MLKAFADDYADLKLQPNGAIDKEMLNDAKCLR